MIGGTKHLGARCPGDGLWLVTSGNWKWKLWDQGAGQQWSWAESHSWWSTNVRSGLSAATVCLGRAFPVASDSTWIPAGPWPFLKLTPGTSIPSKYMISKINWFCSPPKWNARHSQEYDRECLQSFQSCTDYNQTPKAGRCWVPGTHPMMWPRLRKEERAGGPQAGPIPSWREEPGVRAESLA